MSLIGGSVVTGLIVVLAVAAGFFIWRRQLDLAFGFLAATFALFGGRIEVLGQIDLLNHPYDPSTFGTGVSRWSYTSWGALPQWAYETPYYLAALFGALAIVAFFVSMWSAHKVRVGYELQDAANSGRMRDSVDIKSTEHVKQP